MISYNEGHVDFQQKGTANPQGSIACLVFVTLHLDMDLTSKIRRIRS